MPAASEPLRSDFCAFFLLFFFFKESDSGGFLSLHRFYARGIVAYRLSGAELDSAMRTLPKSKTCEVYCVSGNGHSGCSTAQVNHGCALLIARKRPCQTELCSLFTLYILFIQIN